MQRDSFDAWVDEVAGISSAPELLDVGGWAWWSGDARPGQVHAGRASVSQRREG